MVKYLCTEYTVYYRKLFIFFPNSYFSGYKIIRSLKFTIVILELQTFYSPRDSTHSENKYLSAYKPLNKQ